MPSFGGYVAKTFTYLVPVLAAMVLLFIAPGLLWKALGGVLTVGLLALDARLLSQSRRLALADQAVRRAMEGRPPRRVIVVPDKIVNLVV